MIRSAWQAPRLHALTTLLALLTSGCLGHLYEVPRPELERLAQTPPEQRGQQVYAVQQFSTASEPESAPAWPPPYGEPPPGYSMSMDGYWVPDIYIHYGAPTYQPPAPVYQTPAVHDATPVTDTTSNRHSASSASTSLGDIKGADKLLVLAVVVGVAVGVGLAATEGARYEGNVAVHPHHPLHLWYRNGAQSIVALDELAPEHLQGIDRAELSGHEGAGLWELGAAPLNREGFTYQFGAGNDNLALPGRLNQRGLGFHFALGYFPTKKLGLLADSRLQFGDDSNNSYYNARLGLEAQWYPIALWRLHLGPFAGGGQSWSASAGSELPTTSGERPYVSFGGLAELELSTRLGLTFRWAQDWLPTASANTRGFYSSWMVGLAIY